MIESLEFEVQDEEYERCKPEGRICCFSYKKKGEIANEIVREINQEERSRE